MLFLFSLRDPHNSRHPLPGLKLMRAPLWFKLIFIEITIVDYIFLVKSFIAF